MNKKFLATLLVGAIAATSIIGFTACNGNNGNNGGDENGDETPVEELQKGEEVTEEQWKAAIKATTEAGNYTVAGYYESKGVATRDDDASVNCLMMEYQQTTISVDLGSSKFYSDSLVGRKSAGAETIGEEDVDVKNPLREYGTVSGSTLWFSVYFEDEDEWRARFNNYNTADVAKEELSTYSSCSVASSLFSISFSETADGTPVTLADAYSLFEYEDGYYKASVYSDGIAVDKVVELTVSIKNGYVIVFNYGYTSEKVYDGLNVNQSVKSECSFSAFGTTAVNAPEGAVAAVEAAIAEKNNK